MYKVISGASECLPGDGIDGYAVLSVNNRLTTKTGGVFYCDITTAPNWASKSLDWKGGDKWYRFGTGTG